jgi:hypothetical protein
MAKPLGFLLITFALAACETPQPTSDAGGDAALVLEPCDGCAPACDEAGLNSCEHESGDNLFCRGCYPACTDGSVASCTVGSPGVPGSLRCLTSSEPETRYCVRTSPGL